MKSNLSVVIPSRTRSNVLACLAAIREHEPAALRVVVDDGIEPALTDTDGLAEIVIPGRRPFIFARNCNLGIRAAGDDDVILCNDDALLRTPGGFTAMQQAACEHPEYGIIGAVTNVTGQPLQKPQGIGLREVPHFAFVCVLIPRRTIEAVGLLDERYCLDYGVEDRDYCEATRRAGLKVGVFDHCFVDHASLVSSFRGDPLAPRSFAQNWALYCEKWGVAA